MSTAGYFPTIDQLVADDLGESSIVEEFFGAFLKMKFNHSVAPLLLMSHREALDVPLIGKYRRWLIQDMLGQHGHRFRSPEESLVGRARQLYGSIQQTPIQALLLTHPSKRRGHDFEYRNCYILSVLGKFDRVITLDSFLRRNIESQLRAILLFSDTRVHHDEFVLGVEEIRTRIAYWEEADM